MRHVSGVKDSLTTDYTSLTPWIHYAAQGTIDSIQLGNGLTESTTYNPRLQPTQIQVPGLLTLGYDFGSTQNNGNVLSQTIIRGSQTWTENYTSCYDGVNRLTCASESGAGSWSQTYGYDNFGNRWVPVSGSSGLPSPSNEVPNGSNWYLSNNRISGWGYDLAGNITAIQNMPRTFGYDAENRQTTATVNGVATTYKYDGEGRRVSKTWNGQTTTFVYDAFGQLAAEYGGPSGDTGTQYLTTDHLGSTRLVTDQYGAAVKCYDYLPFGEEIGNGTAGRGSCFGSGSYPVAGGATNREFTSKERDSETGLDFFDARYFSSAQGRFTSPDEWAGGIVDAYSGGQVGAPGPLPYADITDPQTLNKYGYVRNNPLRYIDPDGHDLWDYVGGAMNAFGSDNMFGVGRQSGNSDFERGQAIGDAVATFTGSVETLFGGGEAVVTSPAALTVVGAAVPAAGVAIAAHGAGTAATGLGNLGVTAFKKSTGPAAADSPGTSASGQATDKHGNKLGPSGKPMVHEAASNTREGARNKALSKGSGAEEHANPKRGRPHFHPERKGKKDPSSAHYTYPD